MDKGNRIPRVGRVRKGGEMGYGTTFTPGSHRVVDLSFGVMRGGC